MYFIKIMIRNRILSCKHYIHFENVACDVYDRSIFDGIDNDLVPRSDDLPQVFVGSIDKETGIADDFEFKFHNGIIVYAGTIHTEDK